MFQYGKCMSFFFPLIQTAMEISGVHVVHANNLHWAQPDLMFLYHLPINFLRHFLVKCYILCTKLSFSCKWALSTYLL